MSAIVASLVMCSGLSAVERRWNVAYAVALVEAADAYSCTVAELLDCRSNEPHASIFCAAGAAATLYAGALDADDLRRVYAYRGSRVWEIAETLHRRMIDVLAPHAQFAQANQAPAAQLRGHA